MADSSSKITFRLSELPDEALPRVEDLPGDWRRVAELIGVRPALLLAEEFRATPIYARNLDGFILQARDRWIRDADLTVVQIARMVGLGVRQVNYIRNSAGPDELDTRQKRLF